MRCDQRAERGVDRTSVVGVGRSSTFGICERLPIVDDGFGMSQEKHYTASGKSSEWRNFNGFSRRTLRRETSPMRVPTHQSRTL